MPSIKAIQEEIVENFSFLPQWDERYAYLIELGQDMPDMPPAYKTDENIVRGCQSTVWLHQTFQDGKVQLMADSDSLIVKGLASLLIQIYSDQPPQAILSAELFFFEKTGLSKHLSSQRANGLMAMIEKIKAFAEASSSSGQS
jgi:cysteine desulfuration protein SufE